MAEEATTTAGTQDGGDAAQPTTGTPDDRDAKIAELEAQKAQWLAEKSNYEALKQQQIEQQARAAQPPTADTGQSRWLQEAEEEIADLEARAAQGDLLARSQLRTLDLLQRQTAQLNSRIEATRIPDTDRDAVEALWKSGKFANLAAAREHHEAVKESAALKARIAELEKGSKGAAREEAHAELRDSTPTDVRPVTATAAKNGVVGQDEYVKKLGEFDAKGDLAGKAEYMRSVTGFRSG